jgi:hypothetical protein
MSTKKTQRFNELSATSKNGKPLNNPTPTLDYTQTLDHIQRSVDNYPAGTDRIRVISGKPIHLQGRGHLESISADTYDDIHEAFKHHQAPRFKESHFILFVGSQTCRLLAIGGYVGGRLNIISQV